MTARRRGFTLFELLVVMAILVFMGVLLVPSLSGFRGDTRQRAVADQIRGELAVARSRAMEEGRPYRVAISGDFTRIRRAPDDENFAQAAAAGSPAPSAVTVDYAFEHVTAVPVADQNVSPPVANTDGWITIATPQPDGTCLDPEDRVLISLQEDGRPGLYVRVRGLTGGSRVVPIGSVNGNGGPQ